MLQTDQYVAHGLLYSKTSLASPFLRLIVENSRLKKVSELLNVSRDTRTNLNGPDGNMHLQVIETFAGTSIDFGTF